MIRYWVIAPYEAEDSNFFNDVWQFDQTSNTISIGWGQLGNVFNMNRPTLNNAITQAFHPKKKRATKMIWNFCHEIQIGDIVLARRGLSTLEGIGTVTRVAYYQPGKNPLLTAPGDEHPNFIDVEWQAELQPKQFNNNVFSRPTVTEISAVEYQKILKV